MPIFFEPWLLYQQPIVRQLAFTIASPNILQNIPDELDLHHTFGLHQPDFWSTQYLRYQPRLKQLDENPQALIDFISRLKSTRLGLRFEHLMWFWLCDAEYHDYELLGHSIQIIDGRNTLGELDFLLFNKNTQSIEHWEVALKFYLAEANFSLEHWYGLNRSDTLQRKLHHFSHKQFQFEQAKGYSIQQRFVVLKGQLYTPHLNTNETTPFWLNTTRRLGTWGQTLFDKDYYRLQRQEWICHDLPLSSDEAKWWTNGLYRHIDQERYYMFRQAPTLCTNVKYM